MEYKQYSIGDDIPLPRRGGGVIRDFSKSGIFLNWTFLSFNNESCWSFNL